MENYETEDVTLSAVDLIKSISEQGYSLETSLADLIDNSISAKAGGPTQVVKSQAVT